MKRKSERIPRPAAAGLRGASIRNVHRLSEDEKHHDLGRLNNLNDYEDKLDKKVAKARAKIATAEAKAKAKAAKAEAKARIAAAETAAQSRSGRFRGLPDGVNVSVQHTEHGSELVVSGLRDDQLRRLLPEVNREVFITVTEDSSSFKAGVMRFVREGIFQTVVKVIAGLIVGYLLLRFGLR